MASSFQVFDRAVSNLTNSSLWPGGVPSGRFQQWMLHDRLRRAQFVLDRLIPVGNDLPAQTPREMNHQRRLEVQRNSAIVLSDDHQHLSLSHVNQFERRQFAAQSESDIRRQTVAG